MKKFKLVALSIVCIVSMLLCIACKPSNPSNSSNSSVDEQPPVGHVCEFGEWETVTPATCYAEGEQKRTCIAADCDKGEDGAPAVETEAIAKVPHTWDHEEFVHDDSFGVSTCTRAGRGVRSCTVAECGHVEYQFEELADHTFGANGICSVCGYDPSKSYTYKTYTSVSPSNWNELTYQDNNDTQIMSYIGSSFFSYNFKYDEKGEILPGEFVMEYSAATALEDVTEDYIGEEWGIPEDATARAYKITLREDLKWDDGTPINASDFVYTMKEQLNPLFQNYRADSFYLGATIIHNAQNYVKQGTTAQTDVATVMANKGYTTIADFLAAEGTAKSVKRRHLNQGFADNSRNIGRLCSDYKGYGYPDGICTPKLKACNFHQIFSCT